MSDGKPIEIDGIKTPDLEDVIAICLRNTNYDSLEELDKGMRADIIAWVQKIYPDDDITNFSRLQGDIVDYSLSYRQEATCARCKKQGAYKRCPTSGKYYEIYPIPNTVPRQFYVWFRECGYRRTSIDDGERKKQEEPKVVSPKGFGFGGY